MDFSTIKCVTLPGNLEAKKMQHGNDVLWEADSGEDYSAEPFFIQNDGSTDGTVTFKKDSSSAPSISVYTSTDNSTWTLLGTTSTAALTATLPANGRLYVRATANQWAYNSSYGNIITADVLFDACGNILSLLYAADYAQYTVLPNYNYTFCKLFYNSTNLVSAGNLIFASNFTVGTCYQMFYGCTSLTTAPELPPKTVSNDACYRMFYGCTSLTTVPDLPATTLNNRSYYEMFRGCNRLSVTPQINATTLGYSCCYQMFYGCTRLITAKDLPATTLADSCYRGMFRNCYWLTKAPELPSTTANVQYCYFEMFKNCSSLEIAPVLPTINIANQCYNFMFSGCSKLKYIKAMFKTTPSSSVTNNWVENVASEGTFVKNASATWTTTGVIGVPSGWTVETASV